MQQVYDGHTCSDQSHNHDAPVLHQIDLPVADGEELSQLVNALIQNVFDQKVKAGDVDAGTWRYNTEQYWKAIREGWDSAPKYFSKEQIQLLELRRNVNIFAAFKNHVNVIEMATALTGSDGMPLSFSKFKKIALGISEKYNVNWLQAEYNFAKASAQGAALWQSFQGKSGKLEYLTVGDGRVRDEHRKLHGSIFPVDHPFWKTYFPPNGWRCRCFTRWRPDTTQDVSPKELPDVIEMFRNNVGETSQIFTNAHPFIRAAGGAMASKIRQLAEQATMRWERTFIKDFARENLVGKSVPLVKGEFNGKITFTNQGIKEAANQPHKNILAKNRAILNIESLLKTSSYIGAVPATQGIAVKQFHYFAIEIEGETSYAVVKEMKSGQMVFYSIVDTIK